MAGPPPHAVEVSDGKIARPIEAITEDCCSAFGIAPIPGEDLAAAYEDLALLTDGHVGARAVDDADRDAFGRARINEGSQDMRDARTSVTCSCTPEPPAQST
jgi:hypothetical protein